MTPKHLIGTVLATPCDAKIRDQTMKTIFSIALTIFATLVSAHPGGTDKNGCHYDHKTGVYHCH
jgi:hypothetical protein